MILPSKSNTYGSLAGLASGFVVAKLSSAAFIATVAGAIGMPEAWVLAAVSVAVGSAVNYGVTHWSELKELDDLVSALPKSYDTYPGDKTAPSSQTNLKLK